MGRINWDAMKTRYDSDGERKYANAVISLINEGAIDESNFSLKGLWESMGKPNLTKDRELGRMISEAEFSEGLNSTMFPVVTGSLINKTVQKAYDQAYAIGDNLVTVLPSSVKDETIVGFTAADVLEEVHEEMPYVEGSFGEKYHKIYNSKYGRIITLSEEAIKFDQTGQFIMRAKNLGKNARSKKESIIMEAVLENASTGVHAAWRPAGTSTTLYSNTSTDPYTTATLDNVIVDNLADETDINAAMTLFAGYTDEAAEFITVVPNILLTSMALVSTAKKVINSAASLVATYSSGVINPYKGDFMPMASPLVDNLKGAKYWFLGDFKSQFIYTEVFPIGTYQAKPGNEDEWKRDVIFGFKVRLMGGCGAISNRYVVMSTGT